MFDFRTIDITDDDISYVQTKFGFEFNEGQKRLIKNWESADIQACPGSGKTTTLAAKLIILAHKIPKSFNRGICIITHTNVAVEEIRKKLGTYSSFYFNYPNHFGTIQSLVNKFLTIPAIKNEFKISPTIDNNSYYNVIDKRNSRDISEAKNYLLRKRIERIGTLSFNIHDFDVSKSINKSEPIVGENTKTYQTILKLKDDILKEGYLKYEEAYSIAFKYLRENPDLKNLFSERFPLVFIDEMQDMETHQATLLNLLFDNDSTLVQRIGDVNQSIFSYNSNEDHSEWIPIRDEEFQLTETKRISQNIAELIKPICVLPQEMNGWVNTNPLNPTIIVYNDNTILSVKDKFGEFLIQNNFEQNAIYKAVGARRNVSRLNINSYWNEFNRGTNSIDFTNIDSHLEYIKLISSQSRNVKETRRAFLDIFCKGLRLCNVKNPITERYFTPKTIVKYFQSIEDQNLLSVMNSNILKWVTISSQTSILKTEISEYLLGLVLYFETEVTNGLNSYLSTSSGGENISLKENSIYTYTNDAGKSVQICFDTIHGVKGETHKATLYLETFNLVYDIGDKILDFIVSNDKKKAIKRRDNAFKKRLPLAYVALTRATHFICIAVHSDRFKPEYVEYFENNDQWNVIRL